MYYCLCCNYSCIARTKFSTKFSSTLVTPEASSTYYVQYTAVLAFPSSTLQASMGQGLRVAFVCTQDNKRRRGPGGRARGAGAGGTDGVGN
jgi:hypothetical protein